MSDAAGAFRMPRAARPGTRPLRTRRAASLNPLLPLALLIYSCMLPQEVHVDAAGQTIFAYRAVALLLLPWLCTQLLRRRLALRPLDGLVLGSALWMIISFSYVYGGLDGMVRGGALAFDLVLPYFLARICVSSLTDLRKLLVMVAPGLALVAMLMIIESVTHTPLARPAAASIFGNLPVFRDGNAVGDFTLTPELRLGLMRAYGPFSHPILAGVFLASLLPLYVNSGIMRWPAWAGRASGIGAFFSLSSAALLSLLIFAILQTYHWLVARVSFLSWKIFVGFLSVATAGLQVVTENGVIPFLSQFTLTPGTAFYRRLIWRYGSESVAAHPWFGIGYDSYQRMEWMPASVDAHWLMLAIRHGLLPALLLFLAMVLAIIILSKRSMTLPPAEARMCFGVISCLSIFTVAGFTVSYFGSTAILFSAILGVAISLCANLPAQSPNRVPRMNPRLPARHSAPWTK